ncbi:MAG TPA: hypothetical protein VL326_14325, partial [Kofleriaceae bacterium]|nr:hypothetical protein [Kofleriaceae bacterium]
PGIGHPAMAFDPVRGVVVMAGADSSQNFSTWEYDGTNWVSKATTTTPIITTSTLAYDAVGHRTLTYALDGTSATASTFAWDGATWTDLGKTRTGNDVTEASLASDPISGRIVAIGGVRPACPQITCGIESSDETWTWIGNGWMQQAQYAPEPRYQMAAVLDTRRDAVVLAGGYDGTASFRDVWELDGMSWSQYLNVPWPQGRHAVALAYDSARDEVVAFGGDDDTVSYADTYVRRSSNWQLAPTTTAPSPRGRAAIAYDVERQRVILFGGNNRAGSAFPDAETWSWNGATWTKLSPAHSPPARSSAAMQWDPIRRELVLFGGADITNLELADTWTWNGTDWTDRTTAFGPSARRDAGMAWDSARGTMVLVGGMNLTPALDDSWEWNGSQWTPLVAANAPPARHSLALVSAPEGAGVLAIGGADLGFSPLGDQWRLRWDGDQTYEQCQSTADIDGDGAKGCADPDCWPVCTPFCPPGAACDPNAPRCGDHSCDGALENCHTCPGDCTCTPVCGDTFCDPTETQAACPGDCTP